MEQSSKPAEAPKPKSRNMMLAIIIVVILVVVGVAVYILIPKGGTATGTPISIYDGQGGATCLSAANCGYNPTTLNVKIGTNATVTWTNTGSLPHTVTSNQTANGSLPTFDSGSGGLPHSSQFTYTFTQAGTYHYYCSIHPWMKAIVVVSA